MDITKLTEDIKKATSDEDLWNTVGKGDVMGLIKATAFLQSKAVGVLFGEVE